LHFFILHSSFFIFRMSITYLEAIREAQARALRDDPRVFIYGQDVGAFGGAFKATKNLAKEFPGRVLDAPISEDAMIGLAVGAAIEGMRPVIEMQFADFSTVGFNQIVNQAATLFWRTNVPCPITVRLPFGGTSGSGPFHSQCIEAIYAHYPGLVVLTPATVEDAYSMLIEAVAIDDPVIFCEHKFLYYHLKAEKLPSEALPVGKARIAREGRRTRPGRLGNRGGGFAFREAAGHRHRDGQRRAHRKIVVRG
jgi:pyruvate dehydrogenase E1 component beta subunit/2-oxoisovalerate dehydrogenase E1 component beta subunit